jgi:hypothetical protein
MRFLVFMRDMLTNNYYLLAPTGSTITPAAAATTWNFNKPPEGAAAPGTSNALGLNTAATGTSNAAAPSGNLFGNRTGTTGGGLFGNLGGGTTNPAATTTAGTTGGSSFGSALPLVPTRTQFPAALVSLVGRNPGLRLVSGFPL